MNDDAATMALLQRESFRYFEQQADGATGLVLDSTAHGAPASIAATGMGLSVYPVGVEHGWISRAAACARTLATLRFFAGSAQGKQADASGYRGFYYHFLEPASGRRAWRSELSSIDTALLLAGVLTAALYFDRDDADEAAVRTLAAALYARVDWRWMLDGGALLSHGWHPEHGFLPWRWDGYDESQLLYLLALGAPDCAIGADSYAAWAAGGQWQTHYGIDYLYAGPLFIHQMPQLWLDLRGLRDARMRARGSDYFENSRRATLAQQCYAADNPQQWEGYGPRCWGITASAGPGEVVRVIDGRARRFHGYLARGAPGGPDDGTLAPWAAAASLPFAPELVHATVAQFQRMDLKGASPQYGFRASFCASYRDADGRRGWISPYHYGLNLGSTVLMVANHYDDFPWRLWRASPWLQRALRRAGFRGGWL
ncbi:MAG TPA: glucoamylase family protein [Telluria sp.]|nr:glucoamylase family protein [Telluria sp.]